MITNAQLQDWKRLVAAASAPPVIAAPLDSKGQQTQLQSTRPLARRIATVHHKPDVAFLQACYVAMPALIAEVEMWRAHQSKVIKELNAMENTPVRVNADAVEHQQGRRRVKR